MLTLRLSIITALASAVLTAGCLYYIHHRRSAEAGRLRWQNNQLRVQAVARARDAAPRNQPVVTVAPPRENPAAVAESLPQTDPIVPPIYRNEGTASPRAALQTFAWSCDQGDARAVANLIVFDEAARAKAVQLFDHMPAQARGSWTSVDDMAAGLLTMSGMSAPFPNADVLERAELEELSTDRVRLRLNGAPRDGTEFQRTAQGWKFAVTEAMVDGYIRRSRERQASQ